MTPHLLFVKTFLSQNVPNMFGVTVWKIYVNLKKKGGIATKCGERIELLIFDKGFTSIRKFANYMKEKIPCDYISEDTIINVIKGKEARKATFQVIAEALDLPVDILLDEKIVFVDEYLKNEVRPQKEECERRPNEYGDGSVNELRTVKYLYDLSQRFYPTGISGWFGNERKYHITTLAELSVYLPLIKIYILADVMSRIDGAIDGFENYVLNQYERLYEEIPDIPAKRYADNCIITLRLKGKASLNTEEKKMYEQLESYWNSDEYKSDYAQYHSIVRRNYDLQNNDIVRSVLETQFPEIYMDEIKWRKEESGYIKPYDNIMPVLKS